MCGGPTVAAFAHDGYEIVDCRRCAHRQAAIAGAVDGDTHVASVYADEYFTGGGAGYANYVAEGPLLRRRGQRYGRLLGEACVRGRVLDVGAAAGFILAGLSDAGWRGVGVEPNQQMVEFATTQLDMDVVCTPFELFAAPVEAGRPADTQFDAVTMVQVVAHFTDPVRALRRAASLLRPGGVLLIETWDRSSRVARMLGPRWHEYSPPSVLHWFSRSGLDAIAPMCGFTAESGGRMLKWIGAQHAASLLAYRAGRHSPFARVAERIPASLALPYPADDLFWTLWRRLP